MNQESKEPIVKELEAICADKPYNSTVEVSVDQWNTYSSWVVGKSNMWALGFRHWIIMNPTYNAESESKHSNQ